MMVMFGGQMEASCSDGIFHAGFLFGRCLVLAPSSLHAVLFVGHHIWRPSLSQVIVFEDRYIWRL